jgi:site-specific DNA recombinase
MGRLTLNVLLSFAQFEREVTGERIRDKIAASKRKGMWMGGVVPMGYDLEDRHLVVNPEEAKRVKEIYKAYLVEGCVSNLQISLEKKGIRSKKRLSKTGNVSGDSVFSRGALYLMLQNRVYLGEITHKGTPYPGQQPAIIDQNLWDRVQLQLKENVQGERRRPRTTSSSLLTGLLYDEASNLFTPSHATKNGRRYRYYVSRALIGPGGNKASGPVRLPADEIEELVLSQMSDLLRSAPRVLDLLRPHSPSITDIQHVTQVAKDYSEDKVRNVLRLVVSRIVVRQSKVEIQLSKNALAKLFYRLRKSAYFRNSQMTCLTCHDPHDILRGKEAVAHYTEACLGCHRGIAHKVSLPPTSTCLSCHMPKREAWKLSSCGCEAGACSLRHPRGRAGDQSA